MAITTQTGQFVSRIDGKRYVIARRDDAGLLSFYLYGPGSRRPEPCRLQRIIDLLGYMPDFTGIPATELPRAWRSE